MDQVPPSKHDDEANAPTVVDAANDRVHAITAAADALRAGGLVVLPTDTVYGLAADAFHQKGTARIFTAKQRSRSLPLPVLVRSPKQLLGLCTDLPQAAERLMAAYWPGPLTLVVPAQPAMQWDLGRTEGTIGVRMPLDDIALDVIRQVGPLAVTSANTSGSPAARTIDEAISQLGDSVEVYVDGGPREGGAASTVVDLTRSTATILRGGDLDEDDVAAVAEGTLDPLEAAARWAERTAT